MAKTPISHISSAGIVARASDPKEVFLEIKDDGHPMVLVRRQLCFIGGTWIGEGARGDTNTFDTFKREFFEELSFERPNRDSVELNLLGLANVERFAPTPQPAVEVLPADEESLNLLKRVIIESAFPIGDFLNTIEKAAFDAADPKNTRDGFTVLVSCWAALLQEDVWTNLLRLQRKFKNISSESLTLVTSLEEIIRTNTKTAFGYDRVLQQFFFRHGFAMAKNLPMVPNTHSVNVGMPLPTYADYLKRYEVAKKPI